MVTLPVSDTGENLALNILLDISPCLAFYRGLGWQEFAKVAGLDGRHDIPIVKVVIVAGDCISVLVSVRWVIVWMAKTPSKLGAWDSLSSIAVAAASRKPWESIL